MNMETVSNGIISSMRTLLTAMLGDAQFGLSSHRQTRSMSSDTYRLLACMLCARYPETPVHCRSDHNVNPNSIPLNQSAIFFKYVVMDGKRFYTSRTVGWNKSSLVHVIIPGPLPNDAYGEVLEILQINRDYGNTGHPLWLGRMRWLKLWYGERAQIWDDL
jgi:hypothetical protein